jgi:SAM-dependent methyltransferase
MRRAGLDTLLAAGRLEDFMSQSYAIRGGRSGRERLRVLSNILQTGTNLFLDRLGIRPGMSCLDVGCGGDDVTRELGRRVGIAGRVVGLDMDAAQVNIVRAEALAQNIKNITYQAADVTQPPDDLGAFDIVYTRFLLCHLPSRVDVLNWMVTRLKPGGVLAIEDCDFSGHFCYPPSKEFARYVDLAGLAMRRRGGDPELGLKLPALFVGAGLRLGGIEVAHPADVAGDAKLLNALTMENFADAIVSDNLAAADEVNHLIATLSAAIEDTEIFASITRRIQVWGRRM